MSTEAQEERAVTADGAVYYSPAVRYREAEEYECAQMYLDTLGVPRLDDTGNAYSLVGRITELARHGTRYRVLYALGRVAQTEPAVWGVPIPPEGRR